MGMPSTFRKGWPALVGHFPDHRTPWTRCRGRGLERLLNRGRPGRRLSELPDRPIGDRNNQDDRGDNGP